jgi:CTP:molybdopterin cytidylyltransferase MocA
MRIVAVVLAAGAGRRIGGPKALLRAGAQSFLARVAERLARPGVAEVVAVLGHQADRVRAHAGLPAGVATVLNPAPETGGMIGSIVVGLEAAAARGADAVVLQPVDHPFIGPATVDVVVAALRDGAHIAVPSHAGRRGHPGGFAAAAWPALRAAPADQGARAVLAAHPDWIVHVPSDEGCLRGIDTPADYERWLGGVVEWVVSPSL